MQYAEIQCDFCHVILPGNHMTHVSDRVVSGQSINPVTHVRYDVYGAPIHSHSNETTTHYGYQQSIICPECLSARRRRKIFVFLTIVAVIGGLVAWLAVRGQSSQKLSAAELAANAASPVASYADQLEQSDPTPVSDRAESSGDTNEAAQLTEADQPPSTEGRSVETAAKVEIELNADTPEIAAAMSKAARQGGSIKWKIGDRQGYAVASEPRTDGCKNVYFSDETMGPSWTSDTNLICP